MIPIDGTIVKMYLPAPLGNEVYGMVKPIDGEIIVYNNEFMGDHSEVYLTHEINGKVSKRVNMISIYEIEFEV